TACVFGLIRYYGQVLEQEVAQSRQELAVRNSQLDKLTSALSTQARLKTSAIEKSARLLLQNYGGFLPLQGQKYAEQIEEASAQMEQLRQDLVGSPGCKTDEIVRYDSAALSFFPSGSCSLNVLAISRDWFSMGLWRNSVAVRHQSPVCCENPAVNSVEQFASGKISLQFRAEAFNVLNHTNFNTFASTRFGSSLF